MHISQQNIRKHDFYRRQDFCRKMLSLLMLLLAFVPSFAKTEMETAESNSSSASENISTSENIASNDSIAPSDSTLSAARSTRAGEETSAQKYYSVDLYAEQYAGGTGTKEDPYQIANDLQLAKLAREVNNGSATSGKYYKLIDDIHLTQGLWMPIGTTSAKVDRFFAGKFNGNGHTISGMHIIWTNESGYQSRWGLFAKIKGSGNSEREFAAVSNLVIDRATVEMKDGYTPQGTSLIKLGILAGEANDNTEISNIIIRNSKLTDNQKTYKSNCEYRIGGVAGYLENAPYRIFNIVSGAEVNMLKNATCNKTTRMGGIFGNASGFYTNQKYYIPPTNIFAHGSVITNTSNKYISVGEIMAFYNSTFFGQFPAANKNTLYYTQEKISTSGSTSYNFGVQKTEDFITDFVKQVNQFIEDNNLEVERWSYSSTTKNASFINNSIKVERRKEDLLSIVKDDTPSEDAYFWYISENNQDFTIGNKDASSTFTLPRQSYNQYVYAEKPDGSERTPTTLIKPIHVSAELITDKSNGTTKYTITIANDVKNADGTDVSTVDLGLDITYQWYNGDKPIENATLCEFTRPSEATFGDKYFCRVNVKSGELNLLTNKDLYVTTVIYLCPEAITINDTIYIAGDDINDGYTPQKAVSTWQGAYRKLNAKGSWNENVIVLIGTSGQDVTNDKDKGFNITKNYQGELLLNESDWNDTKDSPLRRNTTITGKWDGTDYQGTIAIMGDTQGLPLWGDTRFENITFTKTGTTPSIKYRNIYCQYHNLEMGEGIKVTGFDYNAPVYGTLDGAVTNALQIFGGFNNDGRFYPLNTDENIKKFNDAMPHGKEGFSINIKSGFFSCICAGGRQSGNYYFNGMMGTPNMPIKCSINIDINRQWNERNNPKRDIKTFDGIAMGERKNDYDIGIILAGNHEGAMIGDVDITVKSGMVARIVNGSLGNARAITLTKDSKDTDKRFPYNTYMGRANITLDPSKSQYATEGETAEVTNNRVIVTELYGGSTGRGQDNNIVDNPFYGYSTITINGGTFEILPKDNKEKSKILCGIFGAGAGGMNGIGDDKNPTPDQYIPYWNEAKDAMYYGPYSIAKNKPVHYTCYNASNNTTTDVNPMETNTKIVINGGIFGAASEAIDGIYAGGSGYMSQSLWRTTGTPSKYGGNVYGEEGTTVATLTINDGVFYCKNGIFAAGRGTDYYYHEKSYDGKAEDYTALGKTYGNVELNINGGTFHCPIFGGGYGVADTKLKGSTNTIETLSDMARLVGQSTVNISGGTFYQNIYGGGDMAIVENPKASSTEKAIATNIVISDAADIRGSIFAGGNGRKVRAANSLTIANDTWQPDSVGRVIGDTHVTFTGSTQLSPYIYGDIYGGGNLAKVEGNTHVDIYAAHFAGQVFGGGNGRIKDDDGNNLDTALFNSADILGNTNVTLAQDFGGQTDGEDGKKQDNFSINVIWDKIWDSTKQDFIEWKDFDNKTQNENFFKDGKFLNPHNIYGGGNLACKVGTYVDAEGKALTKAAEGTGLATVEVLKGMTPFELLKTQEWKSSYTDNKNPHFSVFGGGYGENTQVGSTNVTVDVEGDYGVYNAEADDDEQLARPHKNNKKTKKAKQNGANSKTRAANNSETNSETNSENNSETNSEPTLPVFDNSKGIPNFTVHSVFGGGYAGIVTDNTQVTVDGQNFIHRVYGGGFGDPEATSESNSTGQVGGKAEVYVKGAKIYGDVFGGGAGVSPKANTAGTSAENSTSSGDANIYFTEVARVKGTTMVNVSDDAKVFGKIYGGGDIANVGPNDKDYQSQKDYTNKPKSETNIDQKTGSPNTNYPYSASNYCTFVNIMGGDIYGEVYGGGKGIKKVTTTDKGKTTYTRYNELGRINGNTLVHVANTFNDSFSTESFDQAGHNIPYIWNRIYGGCAYGTVDGNTLVHIEGGMLGLNIFGGGYGDVPVTDETSSEYIESTDRSVLEQVLGKKYDASQVTFANILGNTMVKIDGGSYIWNQKADVDGNMMTWLATQANSEKTCNSLDEYKLMVRDIKNAKKISDITNPQAKAALNRIQNDGSTKDFFTLSEGNTLAGAFKKNHNIFGGGNRACYVGTYTTGSTADATTAPTTNTGEAIVEINHSPVDVLTDDHQRQVSLFDYTTLQGLCWYIASRNTTHPQFSVFGAGYGANTKVGNTKVYVRPGAMIMSDSIGTLYKIDGKQYRYIGQEKDSVTYAAFQTNLYYDFTKVSSDDLKKYYGSTDGTTNDPNTFRSYHISRMAWTLGLPGFTFIDIHGGGFSGYVAGNTYVEADNQLACNNLYGAGLGAQPYIGENDKYNDDDKETYDFGSIGGSAKVFIKSGTVSQNVYGGGAGIESVYINDGKINLSGAKTGNLVDFPDMARVKKKTEVHIYGESIQNGPLLLDRTLLIGKVYGGGDVANVGTDEAKADSIGRNAYYDGKTFTSLVDVRGGTLLGQFFAGGNGRTLAECKDNTKLGGIYGNAAIVIDKPGMSYPYLEEKNSNSNNEGKGSGTNTTEYDLTSLDPSEEKYLKHPENADKITIEPHLFEHIYGGCQNGTIYGNTYVGIHGGTLYSNAFGGGWGNISTSTTDGKETQLITSADVTGNTHLYVTGGEMGLATYWLDDTRFWEPATIIGGVTYSPQYNPTTQKFKINHNIYGGGNTACKLSGNARVYMEKGLLYETTKVLSGSKLDNYNFFATNEWKEVYNKVGSPHFCVFGGGYGENTIVKGDTWLKIEMTERPSQIDSTLNIKKDEEYKHFVSGYSVMDIVGGGYSGKVEGDTHIFGAGGGFCRCVFGGGFYNSVNKTNIDLKAIDCHDIFGGGLMGDVLQSTNITIGQSAKIASQASDSGSEGNEGSEGSEGTSSQSGFTNKDIFIHGNVYGGNDVSGYVNINDKDGYFSENGGDGTNIHIYGGHIFGDVYGAGNGDYLYALDRKGNTQVTVNEDYPINPNDPNSETVDLVYTVPMRENMPSAWAASDAAKIVNINSWRPLTNKTEIHVEGNSTEDRAQIDGSVYGGGNSATVMKVQAKNTATQSVEVTGSVDINIGSHVNIGSVFMGCNGDALFTATEDNNFMSKFQRLNGSVYDATKELNFADTIDWVNDPSNVSISELYLPTKAKDRPSIYPHLIDLYFQPVEMNFQGALWWGKGLEDCTIGSFYCGGNRGNMNVYPDNNGNAVNYTFPAGLTITDKIVGGCNRANYEYIGVDKKVTHEGGYLLGLTGTGSANTTPAQADDLDGGGPNEVGTRELNPYIQLHIQNEFQPIEVKGAYQGGNVYGGCYETGTIKGNISLIMKSDMLKDKEEKKLKNANDLLATDPSYATLNVYGAGFGMESYVYGNTHITMDSTKCIKPEVDENGKFKGSGVSANFVYGGGQQGNVIGVTNVEIRNGHIFRSVTGGSYSGFVWGSTQVIVGYPKYYQSTTLGKCRYYLKRTDDKHKDLQDYDKSSTIKQMIYLTEGDIVSQAVYDDAIGADDGKDEHKIVFNDPDEPKKSYFKIKDSIPSNWDNVNIYIGEAVYGGGYSLAQGSSVLANNTTVLKYTDQYNLDNGDKENSTVGYGGNTTILVGDDTTEGQTQDHITISQQNNESDNDGGIFGDGHLSYAQGFRSADVTGYGFSEKTIDNPKYINTFQRLDILRLEDNCFTLNGARDYASNYDTNTTNNSNMTPYSISRVGEIKMVATKVSETLGTGKRARNYMGLANNIHYVGAVESNVGFDALWHDNTGKKPTEGDFAEKTYYEVKKSYIDQYYGTDNAAEFNKRNNGTAKNMIGIASGYALKIQNVQTTQEGGKVVDKIFYGPIKGVVEMNLINTHPDEGGGYVYADNEHGVEQEGEAESFLETTGNFVFPFGKNSNAQYIVDDCFPKSYKSQNGDWKKVSAHYWYVTGLNYYYNVHLTGYTYDSSGANAELKFDSDNTDGLTVLSGLKGGQEVSIQSWGMNSGHPEDKKEYSSDLEYRNYLTKDTDKDKVGYDEKVIGGYQLYVGASDSYTFNGATSDDDEDKESKGFSALLPMNATDTYEGNPINSTLPTELSEDAKIAFQLVDKVDNTTSEYYQKHLSKKSKATLVLTAPALDENGEQRVDKDNKNLNYTYTINLTIEYVQGPSISGEITIDNCALPGEMIRLKKDKVTIDADQSFSATGYYWHIGKLKTDAEGKLSFEDGTAWMEKPNEQNNNTYKIGDKADKDRTDLFAGSNYDKTKDCLDIPAYYFMNGYGVQLGVTMSGYGDKIFPLGMKANDKLTIHNYHEMSPHKEGVDLHIPEAVERANTENGFAEPRIYISDQQDLTAFGKFITTEGNDGGAHAQFILQNDLTVPSDYVGGTATFKGTLHGNGHVLKGLEANQTLFGQIGKTSGKADDTDATAKNAENAETSGNIYNLGLASGKISNTEVSTDGKKDYYHCCFEYDKDNPVVYEMDGTVKTDYKADDFKYGKVAYDLNGYYRHALEISKEKKATDNKSTDKDDLNTSLKKDAALQYVYDYFANGDYQYAHRSDSITGRITGITYLRRGKDSDLPNYGQAETRHDKNHTIDKARAQGYQAASTDEDGKTIPESRIGDYLPLFNDKGNGTEVMNDFLFWGQSLQSTPADYPTTIGYNQNNDQVFCHQNNYMVNRVYRTDGYYGNTTVSKFHYNAYNLGNSSMSTYVHIPTTTAIDFTADDDNATVFKDFIVKDGVTQNLLVYTVGNDADQTDATEAYGIVSNALTYSESTQESLIKGHHIVKKSNTSSSGESAASTEPNFTTSLLHLVERTPEGKNSEGEDCKNNDFCVPIPFEVSDHAWYVRKPQYYAEDVTGAWEGICLPFTAKKVVASLNGEITHFYGAESTDANGAEAAGSNSINTTTQHHEYWLRGLTDIDTENGKTSATFMRPGKSSASDTKVASSASTGSVLFTQSSETMDYKFNNSFFADTYGNLSYNKVDNPYYTQPQEYKDYLPLAANVPYVVRFPGERYYEFDLSSKFYNNLMSKNVAAQTITFNAYGAASSENNSESSENSESQKSALVIPMTEAMKTEKSGYVHQGTFAAKSVGGEVYGMNVDGTAFDDASTLQTVMPFRTYMAKATTTSQSRATSSSRTATTPSVIYISESRSIDKINPEVKGDEEQSGDYLSVRPLGQRRVRIESTYATTLNVYTLSGQLYRILDVQPGTATYSGFAPALYIFGGSKVIVK